MIHLTQSFPNLRGATEGVGEKSRSTSNMQHFINPSSLQSNLLLSLGNFCSVGGAREGEGAVWRGGGILEVDEGAGSIPILLYRPPPKSLDG